MSEEFKLHLRPSDQSVMIKKDQNILECLREKDIYVKSSCGGHATCGDCVVKIATGEDNLTPQTFEELKLLGNIFHITKERLACQTCVLGDVTVDLSNHDKAADAQKLRGKPGPQQKKKNFQVRKKEDIAVKESLPVEEKGPDKGKDGGFRKHRGFKKIKY